jgi:hypothetical protein
LVLKSHDRRLGFLALGVLLILLTALTMILSAFWGSNHYKVATGYSSVEGLGFDSGLDGLLGGQTNGDGTACFWIGDGASRMVLVWPQRFSAGGHPLAIIDGKGHALATVGQYVGLRGGRAPEGSDRALGCPRTQEFLVGEVVDATN